MWFEGIYFIWIYLRLVWKEIKVQQDLKVRKSCQINKENHLWNLNSGDTGDQGPQGIVGLQGNIGAKGEKGDKGINGTKGDLGEIGDVGDEGIVGKNH